MYVTGSVTFDSCSLHHNTTYHTSHITCHTPHPHPRPLPLPPLPQFEFVFKGLDSLGYKEHLDYELVEATMPDNSKCVVRANVFRDHRQTVQFVDPQHSERLSQAELLVIDEAAAIPLPVVKRLLGPYLVFFASTGELIICIYVL